MEVLLVVPLNGFRFFKFMIDGPSPVAMTRRVKPWTIVDAHIGLTIDMNKSEWICIS
jgi:hypothetical protein